MREIPFKPEKEVVTIYDKLYVTPDGTGCAEKTIHASLWAGYIGFAFAGLDVIAYSKPQTIAAGAVRMGSFILPAAAVGAAYCSGTCLASKVTGYDDGINHLFGGWLAGTVIGARAKSIQTGLVTGLALGAAGYMAKKAYVENVRLIPRPSDDRSIPDQGTFFHYNRSFDPWRKDVDRTSS